MIFDIILKFIISAKKAKEVLILNKKLKHYILSVKSDKPRNNS